MNLQLSVFIFFLIYIRNGDTVGSCHYFSDHKLDWFDALFSCQKKKLCLANLDSKIVFDQIVAKLPEKYRDEFWFGLNGYEKYTFKYVSNDAPMLYTPPESEINLEKPCGFIKPIGEKDFTIETGNCRRRRKYICSSAVKCNGLVTKSSFTPIFTSELPCNISSEVMDILGIPK
ncbi:uncharacterized protein LOC117782761 [Drosophila innubila]|uniref:uncharacterized protein LOC117782761 n=1 Tax=Drosophila innubila TaxID=198719 RepID=UPI00148CB27A|nr:uncharacterized protein LOC117782761 [Drosophila innubila]